ncbi:MAG: branched-chain amino acid transaminase [Candidatus Marsarchaeota archaeon]|nr:branched-chain amino acid transaminase [Candidatus Marsarchaeota archaeon]
MPNINDKLSVWYNGRILGYKNANVSILTHSLQYGSGIFEGIRAYEAKDGTAVFRLDEHISRFLNSAKIYRMNLGYSHKEIKHAIINVIKKNNLKSCYIRPYAFYDDDKIGLAIENKKISTYIAAVEFGAYFGDSKTKGINCKVSSWHRINSKILPIKAKASGNYLNSIIASSEAKTMGFDEAILISDSGYVAEGPGENIFLVKDGRLITPNEGSDILLGITRNTIIEIAEDMGFIVEQRFVRRDELYTADELFFTGTAAEITPILSVDKIKISKNPGPITTALSNKYDAIVHGKEIAYNGWLTYL